MNSCILLNIQVSQGNAATYLRRGGKFYSVFFCSSSQNAGVKELLKLVHICHQRYDRRTALVFFDPRCRRENVEQSNKRKKTATNKCQTPLHGHRLRTCCTTPPTDKLTSILQQICYIAVPEPDISTCQDLGMWQIFCPLVVNLLYNKL